MLSCQNNIFYPLSQQFKSRRRRLQLQNWWNYGWLDSKIKRGMASLYFELHPPNFANQHNFFRCTNDVTKIFWYLYWFHIYKKPLGVSFPGAPVFFDSCNKQKSYALIIDYMWLVFAYLDIIHQTIQLYKYKHQLFCHIKHPLYCIHILQRPNLSL